MAIQPQSETAVSLEKDKPVSRTDKDFTDGGTLPDTPFASSPSLPHPYVVGPLDAAQVTTCSVRLPDSEAISILVPAHLSPSWFTPRAFAEGCEEGATLEDDYLHEGEEWSVPALLNLVYRNMMDLYRYATDPHIGPWTLGFVCSFLTRIAQRDRTLALTGLAHVCYLLSFLSPAPLPLAYAGLACADSFHMEVLKAYRAQVRLYRNAGKSFAEAQRLALIEVIGEVVN